MVPIQLCLNGKQQHHASKIAEAHTFTGEELAGRVHVIVIKEGQVQGVVDGNSELPTGRGCSLGDACRKGHNGKELSGNHCQNGVCTNGGSQFGRGSTEGDVPKEQDGEAGQAAARSGTLYMEHGGRNVCSSF